MTGRLAGFAIVMTALGLQYWLPMLQHKAETPLSERGNGSLSTTRQRTARRRIHLVP